MSKIVPLIKVCDFEGGSQPPKDEWINEEKDGYIRMLQIRDFTQGTSKKEYILRKDSTKVCGEDDILIARYGASVGKILTGLKGAYNVAIIKTIPDENQLIKKYLYYYLKSPIFQRFILNVGTRAAQAGFNKEDLKKINIYLPSIEIQRQIVEALEKAQSLIDKRKAQIVALDQLTQSVFNDMFGDPINNNKSWKVARLGDLAKDIKYGTNEKSSDNKPEHGLPVLRIPNIEPSKLNLKEVKFVKLDEKESKKLILENGDLLFVRSNGNPNYIGRCAMFNLAENFVYASYLIRVRIKQEEILPEFLQYQLSTQKFRKSIAKLSRTTAGNYNLNTQSLRNIQVILPPISLQEECLNKIIKIKLHERKLQDSYQILSNLFNSLLQRAFKGELFIQEKLPNA